VTPPGETPPRAAPLAPERDESFIPFSMIEPLLQEGMTAVELAKVILERLGLQHGDGGYNIRFVGGLSGRDAVKFGVRIVRFDPQVVRHSWRHERVR
jgi:hypothetical protein